MVLKRLGMLALTLLGVTLGTAQAQDSRSGQIKVVVPTGAGTIADTVTRLMAQDISSQLGQTVYVEDRVGANGMLAARHVANAAPDGLTLIVGNVSTHAANEFLYNDLGYDPVADFTPVALVGTVPQVLVVSNALRIETFEQFRALAKEKQASGKLNFATASSLTLVAMDAIAHAAGIEMVQVPFGATPQALNEMMANRVDAMVVDLGVAKGLIEAGKIKPLLTAMTKRSPLLPDLPSLSDVKLPDYDFAGWFAWYAPKKTPPEVVSRITAALLAAARKLENQQKLSKLGVLLTDAGPDEEREFVLRQRSMYKELIAAAGIQKQ